MKKLLCMLFGHRLHVVQSFSPVCRKVHCVRCDNYFAMHDGVRAFLPWDEDFEFLYATVCGFGRTKR